LAHRQKVLDLGSGRGQATRELMRRTGGIVVALDHNTDSLHESNYKLDSLRVAGAADWLPFKQASFDLVFCQNALLWMKPLVDVVREIFRVLEPGGWLAAIEPDFGGLIESPADISARDIWLEVLVRVGAEPLIGRKLPSLLEKAGFQVQVLLLDRLEPGNEERLRFLLELPLTSEERKLLDKIQSRIRDRAGWKQFAHLPYFLLIARKI
jgi:ubiquinone/menaquinone biosynthesis C-methylase UbiE